MRIIHITPDYYPTTGGGELYVKEVSERLAVRGHDVTVLTMNSRGASGRNGEPLASGEVLNGVTVRRLLSSYRWHKRLLRIRGAHRALGIAFGTDRSEMLSLSPWSPAALLLTLRSKADVVGVFNWYHGSIAYQTALARGWAGFTLVGVPLFHTERPWAHSKLFGRILARCDLVAVMTEHEQRFVEGRCRGSNALVVGAGVEPRAFARADGRTLRARFGLNGAPVVGYVGRMSASKGVLTLIAAMRLLWQRDPSVRLLLAGSGLPSTPTCDEEIQRAFADLSATERSRIVTVSAFSDDEKASVFDALDIFAMPSVAESFGMAYLEAWMCRKAVIGARIGSTTCVIRDGVDGRLVEPHAPEDLATSIAALLHAPDVRERMGRAGQAKALAGFTWDTVVDSIEDAYQAARARRAAGAGALRRAVV